ncbi:UNVERIFIED_CONTAM: hypothetical protein GTU68_018663 [Idotea baltica]|nr:hypothetical protein [Idotea baltica]
MRRYLNEFLSDKRVIDYSAWIWQPLLQLIILTKRPFSSGAAYKSIWNHEAGESPLMTITKDQTAKIKAEMAERHGDQVMVDFCMRYGNPSTKSKVRAMIDAGCQKILFFPCQCQKTTRLLKERLGWPDTDIKTTFQSRFGPEEWLKPYTVEEVARLAEEGKKNIAVCAPAFSADCIETLEEINEEIKESFEEAGGESFTYIPCLNDDDAHIAALSKVIDDNLKGWVG